MASDKPKNVALQVLEQRGILEKRNYSVDPQEVLVDGVYLSELLDSYKRASRRSGVIS